MPVNKSCTNCPGATDHDTAHCPLFLLRERLRLNEDLPPKWYALVLRELDAFTAELRGHRPEQAEGAQGEREAACKALSPENQRVVPVQPLLAEPHPLAALAQPSPAPELERPEVVATTDFSTDAGVTLKKAGWGGEDDCDLMTVAQHDRIVGALRADLDEATRCQLSAEQSLSSALGENAVLREKFEAAQARVAELEARAFLSTPTEAMLKAYREVSPGWLCLDGWRAMMEVAPVAQAGQVPDGYVLAPLEPTTERVDAAMEKVAELEKQGPVGYRARFLKEPEKWMSNWGMPVPANPNPAAEYQLLYAAPVAPAGKVPEKITDAMTAAGLKADKEFHRCAADRIDCIFKAMLAAAPAQGGE